MFPQFSIVRLAVLFLATSGLKAQKRPLPANVILLISDDHSAPFLGSYGYRDISTPNIDRLAGEGLLFTNAFTTAPQCVLSRAAFMTGRLTPDVRMTRFSAPLAADVVFVPPSASRP